MDTRREVNQIFKHFDRYHTRSVRRSSTTASTPTTASTTTVYDEGFRRYHTGMRMPILWVDQMEAVEDYCPEGRRPTTRMRCAVSARSMHEAGISITEVHGNQLTDTSPSEVWREDRMHDIYWYDNRFWEVAGFQIRGRVQGRGRGHRHQRYRDLPLPMMRCSTCSPEERHE